MNVFSEIIIFLVEVTFQELDPRKYTTMKIKLNPHPQSSPINDQNCHQKETSHLTCSANQLIGLYMITLAFNGLIILATRPRVNVHYTLI